jgi:hypothetical protein
MNSTQREAWTKARLPEGFVTTATQKTPLFFLVISIVESGTQPDLHLTLVPTAGFFSFRL